VDVGAGGTRGFLLTGKVTHKKVQMSIYIGFGFEYSRDRNRDVYDCRVFNISNISASLFLKWATASPISPQSKRIGVVRYPKQNKT
jgi:hypothetical protein